MNIPPFPPFRLGMLTMDQQRRFWGGHLNTNVGISDIGFFVSSATCSLQHVEQANKRLANGLI